MMSSNSYSTEPADDFPEVDDYSEVDALDAVAAEVAAELANTNGAVPEAPEAPTEPPSPERMAAALAEQVGLDLAAGEPSGGHQHPSDTVGDDPANDEPIDVGPVDLVEQGLVDDDVDHPAAARAGWFPPVTESDQDQPEPPAEPTMNTSGSPEDDAEVVDPPSPAPGVEPIGDEGHQQSPPVDRPPSSPPIERAPLVAQPQAEPARPQPARAETEANAHPIDQIAVRKLGGFNFLSIGQWSALPRDERARLLKGGLVMFLYEGEEVPTRPALLWLQQMARSEGHHPGAPPTRRRGR